MELKSISESCKKLKVGRTTLWSMCRDGKLAKPITIGARRKMFIDSDLDAYIESQITERDRRAA